MCTSPRRTAVIRFLSAAVFAISIAGCGASHKGTDTPRGTVRFTGEPSDAELVINETHLGPIGMFETQGVLLRPGPQRVEVRKPGYFTEYRMVEVRANKLTEVDVRLREMP